MDYFRKEIDDKLVALKAMERQLSDKEKELQEVRRADGVCLYLMTTDDL